MAYGKIIHKTDEVVVYGYGSRVEFKNLKETKGEYMLNNKLSSCENIVSLSKEIANNYLEYTFENGCNGEEVVVSDMHEVLELCDKLLTYDYFNKSEKYLETKNHEVISKFKPYKIWLKLYNKDVNTKQKDLRKMLNLISRNIEVI